MLKIFALIGNRVCPGPQRRGDISPKLGAGGVFFRFLTPVAKKRLDIQKCAQEVSYCKSKDLQILFSTFLWYLKRFLR